MLKGFGFGNSNADRKFAIAAYTLTCALTWRPGNYTEPSRNRYRLQSGKARLHGHLVQAADLCGIFID